MSAATPTPEQAAMGAAADRQQSPQALDHLAWSTGLDGKRYCEVSATLAEKTEQNILEFIRLHGGIDSAIEYADSETKKAHGQMSSVWSTLVGALIRRRNAS